MYICHSTLECTRPPADHLYTSPHLGDIQMGREQIPSVSHRHQCLACNASLFLAQFRISQHWIVSERCRLEFETYTSSSLVSLVYAIASIVALCIINVFHGMISYLYYNQIYSAAYATPSSPNALHLSLYPGYSLCFLDRIGFAVLSVLFCLYQILILVWTFWKPYKRRRLMKQKDEKNRAEFMHIMENNEATRMK